MSFAKLLDHVGLRRPLLHVRAVEALHELGVEDGWHRLHRRELFANGIEVLRAKDASVLGRFVRVVREEIPAAEDEVFELRERHELRDLGLSLLGSLSEANRPELGHRPDGLAEPSAREHDARDERRCDCSHAREKNRELSTCSGDRFRTLHPDLSSWALRTVRFGKNRHSRATRTPRPRRHRAARTPQTQRKRTFSSTVRIKPMLRPCLALRFRNTTETRSVPPKYAPDCECFRAHLALRTNAA